MLIIPVVDIRNAQAVRAIAGRRDRYEPCSTPLCASSDPVQVIQAYSSLYPFTTMYLADLDAIENTGSNHVIVERLLQQFPDITFWLDAGFRRYNQMEAWMHSSRLRPVIGSESHNNANAIRALLAQGARQKPLLSLDFKKGHLLGPKELLDDPQHWPSEIILMQLDRVGANQGPAAEPIKGFDPQANRFYAAGGVRDKTDLEQLVEQGYAGVLVASALHDKRLGSEEIAAFMANEI